MTFNNLFCGIKYRVVELDVDKYFLLPVGVKEGIINDNFFKTVDEVLCIPNSGSAFRQKYVIDKIYSLEELSEVYEYDDSNRQFLEEYFYNDHKDVFLYVEVDNENDIIENYEIDLSLIKKKEEVLTYLYDKDEPILLLNKDALDNILKQDDARKIRLLLEKYRKGLVNFEQYNENKGLNKIKIKNGNIEEIEMSGHLNICSNISSNLMDDKNEGKNSYDGLRKAIKEKVFGHDEEIDTLAQKIYMNYTAEEGESTDAILLVGPTGTGKTETINACCEYLNIPSVCINATNLVPEGIKGLSVEDVIISLYDGANQDLEKAQRGLIFLDEFDKLNDSELDIKTVMRNILLTFTAGGNFPINRDGLDIIFNSKMTNKVFAGVFDKITETRKTTGFITEEKKNINLRQTDVRRLILEKGYFSLEELSRISTILLYHDLERETKKRILLESKLSELVKKQERYKRQFGIDLIVLDDFIEAILDSVSPNDTGMRVINNMVKTVMDNAERAVLENEMKGYKKLVISQKTVINPTKFDLY